MFRRIGEAFRRFMYGRYGSDELNIGLLVTAVIVSLLHSILTLFLGGRQVYVMIISPLLYLLILGLLGFNLFRTFSRNIYARQKENRWFRQVWARIKDRKNRYFRCPKCGEKFIRKT